MEQKKVKFGKHIGMLVSELVETQGGYVKWVLDNVGDGSKSTLLNELVLDMDEYEDTKHKAAMLTMGGVVVGEVLDFESATVDSNKSVAGKAIQKYKEAGVIYSEAVVNEFVECTPDFNVIVEGVKPTQYIPTSDNSGDDSVYACSPQRFTEKHKGTPIDWLDLSMICVVIYRLVKPLNQPLIQHVLDFNGKDTVDSMDDSPF